MARIVPLAAALAALAACKLVVAPADDSPCTSEEHECPLPDGQVSCVRNDSPGGCGTSCSPCPVPAHATATACTAGTCTFACAAGWHACGDLCADDGAVETCGTRCTPCPATAVAHALTACLGGACGYACEAGFDPCTAGCCPAPPSTVTGPAAFSAGTRHSCGFTAGGLACWGVNDRGQVGSGSQAAAVLSPELVAAQGFRQVSGGYWVTCALDLTGGVSLWGAGFRTPFAVPGLSGASLQVAATGSGCCALLAGGGVECFEGSDGYAVHPVAGISGALAIAASAWGWGCAVTGPASAACWGDNGHGQLGNPSAGASEPAPVAVTNLSGATLLRALALGQSHGCAAYDAAGVQGAVRCWGRGSEGQLGGGSSPAESHTAVEVVDASLRPLTGVVALAAGSWHTCAVDAAGATWCWGGRNTAAPVAGLGPALAVVAGEAHTCALADRGGGAWEPWCWGANQLGQLGDGTRTSRDVPAAVPGF